MSKSLGNVVTIKEYLDENPADLLRMVCMMSNWTEVCVFNYWITMKLFRLTLSKLFGITNKTFSESLGNNLTLLNTMFVWFLAFVQIDILYYFLNVLFKFTNNY